MEPFQYQDGLEGTASALSALTDELGTAHDRLNTAEDQWLAKYDVIAAELKDQMADEGRKGDPAEHYITTITRRRFPDLHRELREAKRAVERLTVQSSNRRSETTAYQSLIKSEGSISGVDASASQRRGLPVHGQRRAA